MAQKSRGRPSSYRPEFCGQARKLALFGATDAEVAWFFDASLDDLASWAWDSREFFDAITPSPAEVAAYRNAISAKRQARNSRRRSNASADPSSRVVNNIRSRMWAALRGATRGKLFSRLGYSKDDMISHLEARFAPGMSWRNYGEWHVDHVKPCALFDMTVPAHFAECWALINLQPLWAGDNIRKGAKYAGA